MFRTYEEERRTLESILNWLNIEHELIVKPAPKHQAKNLVCFMRLNNKWIKRTSVCYYNPKSTPSYGTSRNMTFIKILEELKRRNIIDYQYSNEYLKIKRKRDGQEILIFYHETLKKHDFT